MNRLKEEIVQEVDDTITSILEQLRDGVFRNEDSRKLFAQMIIQLALSRDVRAKKAVKRLGDYLTDLGHELLGTSIEEELEEPVVKMDAEVIKNSPKNKYDLGLSEKRYKSIFQ